MTPLKLAISKIQASGKHGISTARLFDAVRPMPAWSDIHKLIQDGLVKVRGYDGLVWTGGRA